MCDSGSHRKLPPSRLRVQDLIQVGFWDSGMLGMGGWMWTKSLFSMGSCYH